MDKTVVEKASLWREGLKAAWFFLKAEWQWVAVFAGALAIKSIIPILNYDSQALIEQFKEGEGDVTVWAEAFQNAWPNVVFSPLADLVIMLVATYALTVLFFRHEGGEGAPSFSFGGFFFWFGKVIQKYALLVAPVVVLTIVGFVVFSREMPLSLQEGTSWVFTFLSFLCILYFYVGLYRLYMVTPMAVLREKSPITSSFNLTKGNLIRLWLGAMVLWGIMYAVLFPLLVAEYGLLKLFGQVATQQHTAAILVSCVWQAVSTSVIVVYACVAYRFLSKEQVEPGLTA